MTATRKPNDPLIGALDQGTTSTRFILFSRRGEIVASAQKEHKQVYPQQGYVEHDPEEIWNNVVEVMNATMAKLATIPGRSKNDVVAIGITNQRETTVVWNRLTSKPYHNAVVWMDMRSQGVCDSISRDKEEFRNKTGLPLSPYFAGTKIRWILDNVRGVRADAEAGLALAGTIDTWLLWKMSNGKRHITDCTNASRYLLMNLTTLDWDDAILSRFGIPRAMLPQIVSSSEVYFTCESPSSLAGVPVSGVLGDQQAALVGQCAFHKGSAKNTYGTGLFMLMNVGESIPPPSKSGLITTVGYRLGPKAPVVYALEGSVAIGGALIQWLRDNLQIIKSSGEVEAIAAQTPDNGGVYVVPAFSGLYAPYWREDARGVICGLTRFANRSHIVRAALEATAYQTYDVFKAMEMDSGLQLKEMRVDGGMVVNNLLMQFQADVLEAPIIRPRVNETTALGCAYAAGLAVGAWRTIEEVEADWPGVDRRFLPDEARRGVVRSHLADWHKAIEKSLNWAIPPTSSM